MLLKLIKAGAAFLAICLLTLSMSMSVLASTDIDMSKLGSITINANGNNSNTSNSFTGIMFTIYKVANLSNSSEYNLTNDFVNSGIQLDKLTTANEVASASRLLAGYVTTKNISGNTNATDANGIVKFKDLTLGYYLVMQTAISSDHNISMICHPFLITVPIKYNDNPNWIYDINAYPKCETAYGAVILNKVSSVGIDLQGAVFRLENKVYYSDTEKIPIGVQIGNDGSGKYYWNTLFSSLTTNNYGQIVVKNMPYAKYRFVETTAPPGYILDTTPHEFTVAEAGSVTLSNGKYTTATGTVRTITIYNVLANNNYPPSNPTSSSTVTSTPTPTPTPIPTLTPTLRPTPSTHPKPTKGAIKSPKRIKDNGDTPPDSIMPNREITPKKNQKGDGMPNRFNLPKTGGDITYAVCTYGGIVLMISGIVIFIVSRKKKISYEN